MCSHALLSRLLRVTRARRCVQSLVFDEYGRPYYIIREQEKKARLKGLEAQKANITAARLVSSLVRTSLGPKGASRRSHCRTHVSYC